MSHNGGWCESGDHRQNVFSSIATTAMTTTSASGYFVGDSFLPFGVDAGDAQHQFENVDDYLASDDVDDERRFNYLAQSDYQQPLPQPEINAQYLKELETDKCFLVSLCQALAPPYFYHAAKLLDDEIVRVESILGRDLVVSVLSEEENAVFADVVDLPCADGDVVTIEEKVVVPVDTNPEYNFIGRLMGPRGMTIKRLEQETGCRLLVRGRGSIKNGAKEEALRRKPGFEHLNETLHILIQAKDVENRVHMKLARGVEAVKQMLTPVANDQLKQRQMRELAIINGTYRPVRLHQANVTPNENGFGQMQNFY